MSGTPKGAYKLGDSWLGQRSGSPTWYRYWYDAGRQCTRRASLGTTSLEEAKEKLTEWFVRTHTPRDASLDDVLLADIARRYYEEYGMDLPSWDTARISLDLWLDFFGTATLEDATRPEKIDEFITHLQAKELSASYINRILSVGRAAINRAYKRGQIKHSPFIRDVKVGAQPPKGRPLEVNEVRALYHSTRFTHLRTFILWMIGTAARPDAILELQWHQVDLTHELVELNPPGRAQTKKYRPTVKLPKTLRNRIIEERKAEQRKARRKAGKAAKKKTPVTHVVNYGGRPMQSIKSAWRTARDKCGFEKDVNPYSLRHTIARHLRARGVSAWEVSRHAITLGSAASAMQIMSRVYGTRQPERCTSLHCEARQTAGKVFEKIEFCNFRGPAPVLIAKAEILNIPPVRSAQMDVNRSLV